VFGMTAQMKRKRLEEGGSFFCPNGHSQHYTETKVEKLKRQLQAAKQNSEYFQERMREERDAKEAERRSKAAYKGQLTKAKRRVSNGVCPCCNRHFVDLERHMKGQHPEWGEAL
jgi:ssDNA-binding Zn-finger/Zn-ribbon topoisomerase 1